MFVVVVVVVVVVVAVFYCVCDCVCVSGDAHFGSIAIIFWLYDSKRSGSHLDVYL